MPADFQGSVPVAEAGWLMAEDSNYSVAAAMRFVVNPSPGVPYWNTGRSGAKVGLSTEEDHASLKRVRVRLNAAIDMYDAQQLSDFFKTLAETLGYQG